MPHPDIDMLRSIQAQQPSGMFQVSGQWSAFENNVIAAGKALFAALPEASAERTLAFRKLQEALFWGSLAYLRFDPPLLPIKQLSAEQMDYPAVEVKP